MNNRFSPPEPGMVFSHGVWVHKNQVVASDFIKQFNTKTGTESYYAGSWGELENLVISHWDNQEPGTGSVGGDVVLVNVPPEGFFTPIVAITPENKNLVTKTVEPRMSGEKPVEKQTIAGVKPAARFVKIVCYRADVLAADNDRSSTAEWELIAINAQPYQYVPMHPTTMLRNSNHDEGGTLRVYSEAEWAEAYKFWETHAFINQVETNTQ